MESFKRDEILALKRAKLRFNVRSAVRTACLAGAATGLMLGSAGSYAAAASDSDSEGATLQEVVVTGSHLATAGESPSPVQVLTSEEIHESGYTSVQDVLHELTANGQGTLSQGFSGAFASGASGIALRGLTVGSTLVLIDGHRTAPYPIGDDGQRSFVDVANLPFDAIERVEVLKDGASAIYGSDAVAGVVNIILKKSFQGAQVTADGGISSHGDGGQVHFSAIMGAGDLDADGHNAYVSAEFRRQNQITFADRGGLFTQTDFTSTGGINVAPGAQNILTGSTPTSAFPGYVTDATGTVAGFFPGCTAAKFAANECTYKNTWSQLQPTTQNINVVGRLTQKLGTDWQIAFDGGFFQSQSQQVANPSRAFTAGYQGVSSGPGVLPAFTPLLGQTTIPSTNPSFPAGTGLTVANLYYTFLDQGPNITDTSANSYRAVIDLNGKAAGWDVEASAGYTEVSLDITGIGYVNPYNLQTALDSTTAPYLVGQPNSAAVNAFVSPQLNTTDISKLAFGHVGASRDLFQLPGGPFGLAFGGDWYVRDQNALAPAAVAAGDYANAFSNNFTVGTQHVEAGYAEINAPVFKWLEVNAAERYDHYNLSGGKASPKVGFKFTPIPEVALRGTAARGFRAPGPAENGTSGQTFFASAQADPILCPNPTVTTAKGNFAGQCNVAPAFLQSTNPDLKPETSKSWTLGIVLDPIPGSGFSGTFDWYSIQIDNQIVSGGPELLVRGTNFTPLPEYTGNGTNTVLAVPPVAPIAYFGVGYINANSTKTDGFDLSLNYTTRFGAFRYKSEATWSHEALYDVDIGGVHYSLAGTHGPFVVSGDTGNPKNRIQWSNTVGQESWSVTGTMNYIGAFSAADPSAVGFGYGPQGNCIQAMQDSFGLANSDYANAINAGTVPKAVACSVAHYITFDLYGRYDVTKHLAVHGSILNAFNEKAPPDWETYGGGNAPYDPSLHTQGAIGTFFSLGATFTF
jgi:iron complex outermembrane recepter protein